MSFLFHIFRVLNKLTLFQLPIGYFVGLLATTDDASVWPYCFNFVCFIQLFKIRTSETGHLVRQEVFVDHVTTEQTAHVVF